MPPVEPFGAGARMLAPLAGSGYSPPVKSLNAIVGNNIRRARKRAGLSQAQLAASIGCQQPLISRIETGVVSCTLEVLYAVSRATETSAALLLPVMPGDWRFRVMASTWSDSTDHARILIDAGAAMLTRLEGPITEPGERAEQSAPPDPQPPAEEE